MDGVVIILSSWTHLSAVRLNYIINPIIIQKSKQPGWLGVRPDFWTTKTKYVIKTVVRNIAWHFDLIFMPHPLLMTTINPLNPIVSKLLQKKVRDQTFTNDHID